jgi:hypothetical protein
MARNSKNPPGDAEGRFVNLRMPRRPPLESRTEGALADGEVLRQPAVLSLAIVMGVAGFAFADFWIATLILTGILWGTMAMGRTVGFPGQLVRR